MSRVLPALLGIAVAGAVACPTARAQSTPAQAMYTRYVSGDVHAPANTLQSDADFQQMRPELVAAAHAWQGRWQPTYLRFLMDISVVAVTRHFEGATDVLAAARDLVISRPDPPGANAEADAFEIDLHRTVLAMLVGLGRISLATSYLGTIAPRVVPEVAGRDHVLVDPRISLTSAMLIDLRTAPANRPDALVPSRMPSLIVDPSEAAVRRSLQQAERAYAAAEAYPAVEVEAATRRAFVLHRLGRQDEALKALDHARDDQAEPTVRYWAALFRGRVLEALDRPDEARTAYERAAAIWPGAQTPAVALASLLERQGKRADAVKAAAAARRAPSEVIDPWWQYWSGDLRFFDQYLAALRGTQP